MNSAEDIHRLKTSCAELGHTIARDKSLATADLVDEVSIFDADNQVVPRMIHLDFDTKSNIMSEHVQKRLRYRMAPYTGPPIQATRQGLNDLKPLGQITVKWKLPSEEGDYETIFFVIRTDKFDALLGTLSIQREKHKLSVVDPVIAARLAMEK